MALSQLGAAIEIRPFDHHQATREEWEALVEARNLLLAEQLPDDPPNTVENTLAYYKNLPAFVEVRRWAAWVPAAGRPLGSRVVAQAWINFYHTPDNQHLAEFGVQVLPDYRRRGIARQMLPRIVEVARATGRSLLIGETAERIPAGAAFMERLGGTIGLETHLNQLKIEDTNTALLSDWQERARERAADFDLEFWDSLYPEDQIEAIAQLKQAINLAPRGTLEVEDFVWTPEVIRQMQESHTRRGIRRWTIAARHRPSGELAGYTEVLWNPKKAEMLSQEDTAVWPKYRDLGLGRWLKAAMLERVIRDLPEVKRVLTGNADSNEAMLHINYELGFRPYSSEAIWQVPVDKVEEYLRSA